MNDTHTAPLQNHEDAYTKLDFALYINHLAGTRPHLAGNPRRPAK